MRAVVVILIAGGALAALSVPQQETIMTVKRLTPIIFVAEIEPCLPFWTERLGFEGREEGISATAVALVGTIPLTPESP